MKITPLDDWIAKKISCPLGEFSREKIEAYQLTKVNETLRTARESRFYRSTLAKLPEKINSLEELLLFPFVTADDLRDHPLDMVCVPQGDISRIVTMNTSGTMGQPKRVFFTPEDQELTIDFFGVGMSTLVDPGDRVLILLPDNTPGSVGDLLFTGLKRIGANPVKHGPVKDLRETLSIICTENINCLVGVPTQVLALCRFYTLHQADYPLKIKSILLSTDHVPDAIIKTLEEFWNCRVFNHYGMTEMGLGGGVFCEGDHGYHLREADMFFEIIDPESGSRLPDGETGELVFTTLTRKGMPLIRYRTGDQSSFLNAPCPCGSKLHSLQKITGRIVQYFVIGHQQFQLSEFDEILFDMDDLINFRMDVTHSGEKDRLAFYLYSLIPVGNVEEIRKIINFYLEYRGIDLRNVQVDIKPIIGYPEELSSMRKRKIIDQIS